MKTEENLGLVIFGASGDLTERKLIPALYAIYEQGLMPDNFFILGIGRKPLTDASFREKMATAIKNRKEGEFIEHLYYSSINTSLVDDYAILHERLRLLETEYQTNGNTIYYLATPPSLYEPIADHLSLYKLNINENGKGWKRLIIEKPFGYDLESAIRLNKNLLNKFNENQLYRIDHYLGKETVQNILVTRFSNLIFEPVWNRNFIHHVEITASESIGVENRGGYYDKSGALRDMVQNHLMQLVGLTAMEPPVDMNSNAIRNEILKVFQSLRPLNANYIKNNVIRGQYTGSTIKGEKVNGYRQEIDVDPESRTETFVAIKFFIDNWRWSGVPFYIRTGKRLPIRVSEVVIHFKHTPHHLFCNNTELAQNPNQLILRIQPDEGILMKFGMKVPGAGFRVQSVNMDFHYKDLADVRLPSAYERLLLDCMQGDSTLYARGDAVEETWKFLGPVLQTWKNDKNMVIYGYPAGSWGPDVSDELIEGKNLTWRYPCKNLSDDGMFCEL